MNWVFLIVGGLFEAGFTFCMGMMKSASGWTWWTWLLGFIACTFVSMGLLVKASQTLPIGTCYPVWTGVGAVGSVLIGVFFFHEPGMFWRMFLRPFGSKRPEVERFIFTLIASIVGLKMVG